MSGRAGNFVLSLQYASQAVGLAPGNVEYRVQMARALLALEAPEDALLVLREAVSLASEPAPLLKQIGDLLLQAGGLPDAVAVAGRLASQGNELEARLLQARAGFQQQQWAVALEHYEAARRLAPDDYRGFNGTAGVMLGMGEAAQAIPWLEQAMRLNPAAYEPFVNMGLVWERQGDLRKAADYYQTACQMNPHAVTARFNAALAWLKLGDYRRGWAAYEIRFRTPELKPMLPVRDEARLWDGSDPAGLSLLVLGEQGFGDQIQFVRYLPLLERLGARVIFMCAPALLRLFSSLAGAIELHPQGGAVSGHDRQCALMSLPHLLGTTLQTVPAAIPYLHAEAGKVAAWRERIGASDKLKIGLVWSSSHPYAPFRSNRVPLQIFAPLWRCSALRCFSLQMERSPEDRLPKEVGDLAVYIHDFSDTAAALMALDLLITIDTAAAHLAGALGRPVWLIVKHDSEWRWLAGREDSPWYPGMRIFRQGACEDWAGVVDRIASEIDGLAGRNPT